MDVTTSALRHVFATMADQCEAYMGLITDPRSMMVSCARQVSRKQNTKNWLRFFTSPSAAKRKEELIRAALEIGPF